jgi:hypothetical protein
MIEKDFQRALTHGLRSQECFAWGWPDLARAVTKPFDICMAYNGRFLPIECKLTKYGRKKPLHAGDVAISPSNFHGRGHQLPRLLKIYERGQGNPFLSICVARIEMERAVETRAWMLPIYCMKAKETWTIGELDEEECQLTWVPAVGWTAPWLKANP